VVVSVSNTRTIGGHRCRGGGFARPSRSSSLAIGTAKARTARRTSSWLPSAGASEEWILILRVLPGPWWDLKVGLPVGPSLRSDPVLEGEQLPCQPGAVAGQE